MVNHTQTFPYSKLDFVVSCVSVIWNGDTFVIFKDDAGFGLLRDGESECALIFLGSVNVVFATLDQALRLSFMESIIFDN